MGRRSKSTKLKIQHDCVLTVPLSNPPGTRTQPAHPPIQALATTVAAHPLITRATRRRPTTPTRWTRRLRVSTVRLHRATTRISRHRVASEINLRLAASELGSTRRLPRTRRPAGFRRRQVVDILRRRRRMGRRMIKWLAGGCSGFGQRLWRLGCALCGVSIEYRGRLRMCAVMASQAR